MNSDPPSIVLSKPDDWHLHLRDGKAMRDVLPHTADRFRRAIVMPNLRPPVDSVKRAESYRREILSALPEGSDFTPLMVLYLSPALSVQEIAEAAQHPDIVGVKLYPAGATTNSDFGVSDTKSVWSVLEAMQKHGLVLEVHGEDTNPQTDPFDRERVFLETELAPLRKNFPELKIVVEHATTAEAIDFVLEHKHTAASLTAHHLLLDRSALFLGGLRPHHYCLPILKRKKHRKRLIEAATSGNPKFFLGTDSAPHPRRAKESACGCAGIYTAHAGIELYAEVFEKADALDRFEAFASQNGPAFYGLPENKEKIQLKKEPWCVPLSYPFGEGELVPFRAGEEIPWKFVR